MSSSQSSSGSSSIDNNDDYQLGIADNVEIKETEPIDIKDVQEEKPKKASKVNTKSAKVKKAIKQSFNPKFLNHCLNGFYDDYKFKEYSSIKNGKENGKFVIDINNYKALDEFKQTIEKVEEQENRSGTKLKEADKWDEITHSIWNFKLRGILTAINDNYMKKKMDDGTIDTSLFSNHLINQLNFDDVDKFNAKEIVGNIAEFLSSDKFKFKLYNSMFPHPNISQNKTSDKGEHLNKIYLQNISKYHDTYLEMLYTNKVKSDTDLFKLACDKIIKDNCVSNKLTADKLLEFDYKNINGSFTKEERNEFYDVIKMAKYEKIASERYYKCYNLALEQKMITKKDATSKYKSYVETIKKFKDLSKSIMSADVSTYSKFVDLFVSSYKETDKFINYKGSVKTFIKDIDCQKKLMFTQRFKQILTRIINDDKTLTVSYSGKTFNAIYSHSDGKEIKVCGDIIQEERHTFNNVYDSLGKIGLIGGNRVRKDIRVGLGIGLIDYIISETKMFNNKSKKTNNHQKKVIYIKA